MKRFGWVLVGMAVGAGAVAWASRRHSELQLALVQQEVRTLQARVAQLEQIEVEYRAKQQQEAEDAAAEEAELARMEAEDQLRWSKLSPEERMEREMYRAIYYSRASQKPQPLDDDFADEGSSDDV